MSLALRPPLPKLCVPLLASWIGVCVVTELTLQGSEIPPPLPLAAALALSVILFVWFRRKKQLSLILVSMLCACLALSTASGFYLDTKAYADEVFAFEKKQTLVIIEDTKNYENSFGSEAVIYLSQGQEMRVRVFWNDPSLKMPKGTTVSASCSFKPLIKEQRWLFERGIAGTVSLSGIESYGFSDSLWGAIDSFRQNNLAAILGTVDKEPPQNNEEKAQKQNGDEEERGEEAALLAGVLLGYKEALEDTRVKQDFTSCGLMHLVAVSGSHLAVVAVLLGWFFKRVPLSRIVEMILLLAVLALYVMLTGLQPSAIRSALMAGVAGCSVFVGRRGHAPSALTAVATVMLIVYPPNAYSIGFWLSVCAVMGITLFANLVSHWLSAAAPLGKKKAPGLLSSAMAVTLTATAATLPLSLASFCVFSLVGPLANLLVAPLISVMLVLGILALLVMPLALPLGMLLLDAAMWTSHAAVWLASQFASIPFASLPFELPLFVSLLGSVGLAGLLYYIWPQPQKKVMRVGGLIVLGIFFVVAMLVPTAGPSRLVIMDIGQGDALLIQEQGKSVLIDTGASDTALTRALARNHVFTLDAVVITHLDSDHAGALERLRGLVSVQNVYVAQGLLANQGSDPFIQNAQSVTPDQEVQELSCGDKLILGKTLSLTVLWPEHTAREGSNEESLCLLLCYDANSDGVSEQRVLLTGDAEQEELAAILKSNPHLRADLIKIGHHGSGGAITPEQIHLLGAQLALISVGAHNRYGHPAAETLSILKEAKIAVLRTDEGGDILCMFDKGKVEVGYATMAGELS